MKPDYYHKNGIDLFTACKEGLVDIQEFKSFCKLNIIKYVLRYQEKNGEEDLLKAKDYLNELLALEKNTDNPGTYKIVQTWVNHIKD